ncbi:hypothetical protein LCGC14_2109230, partial [marine sediment metagenome]
MSKKNKDVRREDNPKVAEKVIGDGETTFEDEPEITDSDPKIGPDEAVDESNDESEDAMQSDFDVECKPDDEHSEPGNEPNAERDDDKLKAKVEREPDDDVHKAISPE